MREKTRQCISIDMRCLLRCEKIGNDGTLNGGITYVDSDYGKMAQFDGIDDWAIYILVLKDQYGLAIIIWIIKVNIY